jgi:N-acyl-D-aspartate/D-glutamate deacylase
MLEALCDHLVEKPDLYLDEMKLFWLDEFGLAVPKSTISDTLHRISGQTRLLANKQKNGTLI